MVQQTIIFEGKKLKIPAVVAREGSFTLVLQPTKFPKRFLTEFVVRRDTRFGSVLISSKITAKTKSQGMRLLKAAVELERFGKKSAQKGAQLAKKAGIATGRGLLTAGRIGFQLVKRASKPRKRKRGKTKKGKKR